MSNRVKKLSRVVYTVLIISLIICLYTNFAFDYVEFDPAMNWTTRYAAIPTSILLIIYWIYTYPKVILPLEKTYRSKIFTHLRTVFRIITLSAGCFFLLLITITCSAILLNIVLGEGKNINLNTTVMKYHIINNKGVEHKHIIIKDITLGREIDVEVDREYAVGERYITAMKIGKFGWLYSK